MVRIVPSPDWFVGVDSLDLCDGDRWKEQVALDLYPHDAGTDSGFTFSSPNFATIPQEPVTEASGAGRRGSGRRAWDSRARGSWSSGFRGGAGDRPVFQSRGPGDGAHPAPCCPQITSSSPSHPANSFYYPRLKALPPIARVTLERLRHARAFVPPAPHAGATDNEVPENSPSGEGGRRLLWKRCTFPGQPSPRPASLPAQKGPSGRAATVLLQAQGPSGPPASAMSSRRRSYGCRGLRAQTSLKSGAISVESVTRQIFGCKGQSSGSSWGSSGLGGSGLGGAQGCQSLPALVVL